MGKKTDNKSVSASKNIAAKIFTALYLSFEIVFIVMLRITNILPFKYFIAIVILLAVITILIVKLIWNKKKTKGKKIAGCVIAVVCAACLLVGNIYLYSTYDMFNTISDDDYQSDDFYVVVLKDGAYQDIEDIRDDEVFISAVKTEAYNTAQNRLEDKYNVSYEKCIDYLALGHKLVDENGKTYDNIILISDDNYQTLCDELIGFKEKTKILDTITVKLQNTDIAKGVDVTQDSFSVYISGIDTYGNISKVSRSDVNMIVTVNPKTKKILLTSIPRDMFVTLHTYGAKDKLTHSGNYGIQETVTTVEDFLGVNINYYVRVNFTTLEDVVNVLGGIDVQSPNAFTTSDGEYSFVAGSNYLNGAEALAFARERYAFASGDNERVKNQQRVLEAIITKITTDKSILAKYTTLLGTVKNQIQTNMSDSDLSALIKMQLNDMSSWSIETISITGDGTMSTTYSTGNQKVYVMIPDENSVVAAKTAIENIENE